MITLQAPNPSQPHPLPDKASDLIEFALKELKKAPQHPEITVRMLYGWLVFERALDGPAVTCTACLAGLALKAVMVGPPSYIERHEFVPSDFDKDTKHKMYAINWFRSNILLAALREMGIEPTSVKEVVELQEKLRTLHGSPSYYPPAPEFFYRYLEALILGLRTLEL